MTRAIYLSVEQLWRLAHAVRPVEDAFGGQTAYLVGSVLRRPDWRDVDVRIILPDRDFECLFVPAPPETLTDQFRMLIQTAVSGMLRDATGLPVDFQVQRMTDANGLYPDGERNACSKARPYVGPDFIPQWQRT